MSVPTEHAGVGDATAIRPFRVRFPQEELVELRRRVAATRWPERETVADDSQGVPLATMQALAGYWATEHDWRGCEGRLNALGQFRTQIDGLDLHFVHVRSPMGAPCRSSSPTAGRARSSSSSSSSGP